MTNLPAGWESAKLGDVVDILDSRRVPVNSKERETRQGSIPYYGATGQVGWIDDFLFDEELVLLGEDGAPFLDRSKQKAYVIRGKSWVNNHAHVLRPKNGIPSAYIKHYLDLADYHPFVTGTTRLKLNQAAMRQIPVPLAPPDQQKRIVAEIEKQFSRLDEAVANLNRIKANLKRYKAAVLKAAAEGRLVETEDDLARRESRSYETGEQLLNRILTTCSAESQGSRKGKQAAVPDVRSTGELPKGWAWATVEQINLMNRPCAYGVLQPGEDLADGVVFVRVGDIKDGQIDTTALKRISPIIASKYPRTKLAGGELLITLVGAIGRTAVVPQALAGGNVARAVGLIPLSPNVDARWVETWFRSPAKIAEMTSKAHEVARKTLNLEDVRTAAVALPPRVEQQRIVGEVERRLSFALEIEAQVTAKLVRTEHLRRGILAKSFFSETLSKVSETAP
jgi:type I restriction enzyme S subunit